MGHINLDHAPYFPSSFTYPGFLSYIFLLDFSTHNEQGYLQLTVTTSNFSENSTITIMKKLYLHRHLPPLLQNILFLQKNYVIKTCSEPTIFPGSPLSPPVLVYSVIKPPTAAQ
jgi:hypothetical protein